MKIKNLSSKKIADLFVHLKKENKNFKDLCNERDKLVTIIEHHQIVSEALISELKNWDVKVDTMFQKELAKIPTFDNEQKAKSKKVHDI